MTLTTRDLSVSLILTVLLVFLTPEKYLTPLFIVLGQGHFLLMYLYQYRAKKIGVRYVRSYTVIGSLLLGVIILLPNQLGRDLFLLGSAVAFGLHFFFDELFIAGVNYSPSRVALGIGFSIQYIALSYILVFGLSAIPHSIILSFLGVSWALAFPLFYSSIKTRAFYSSEFFLFCIMLVSSSLFFFPTLLSAGQLLGFTVIFHYARWYLFYVRKLQEHGATTDLTHYAINSIGINIILFAGYALYFTFNLPILDIVYSETFFYFWTILHVIFALSFFHRAKPIT